VNLFAKKLPHKVVSTLTKRWTPTLRWHDLTDPITLCNMSNLLHENQRVPLHILDGGIESGTPRHVELSILGAGTIQFGVLDGLVKEPLFRSSRSMERRWRSTSAPLGSSTIDGTHLRPIPYDCLRNKICWSRSIIDDDNKLKPFHNGGRTCDLRFVTPEIFEIEEPANGESKRQWQGYPVTFVSMSRRV
jgi:hypothetical protein